jgi:chorismate mutase/prephenate dehydratase
LFFLFWEYDMVAAFQGVDGAFSQLAVHQFLRERSLDVTTLGMPSYREVAVAVSAQRASVGIIPIENAIVGTVREGYDLVAEFGLIPVAEVLCRTDHRLLGVHGASIEDVREVLAHPLTIAECSRFLQSLPNARAIPCEDTGVAAREVARSGNSAIAALAPPAAARIYDLDELAANCGDHPHTYSRFLIVRSPHQAGDHPIAALARSENRRTSIVFSLDDAPGRLASCLVEFAQRGVNLSKVESKPRLGHGTEHVFYVDLEGDAEQTLVAQALDRVRLRSVQFTLIGSYDAHQGTPIGTDLQPAVHVNTAITANWHPQPIVVRQAHHDEKLPRVSRPARPEGSTLQIGGVRIGDGEFVIIAGPCSVESREQVLQTAQAVRVRGGAMLRGGAFKPRTSPYAFQGLGWEGVDLLAEAGRATGLPTVSEVMTVDQVERMARQIDVLQIGARNMQNFDLLKAVGRTGKPVLLKRGLSATIDELLAAAEYILAEGNPNVMLCERGIRTFEPATRNTLDLSAVPVLRERSHLPVFVDPSHGVGVRRWIRPLCRAAKAVGAHGIIVEVHPNPPEAKSDKEQALTFDDFSQIVADLEQIPLEAMVNA